MESLRDITLVSVLLRLVLAVFCGGLIGWEREDKQKPAGLRTHILICIGAAVTTLTSQYMYLVLGQYTDIARFGAQVVAGLGFIGAGTIVVTQNRRIKGLTTAAGLWTTGIIGLACGAGFYEGAICGVVIVMFIELVIRKLETHHFQDTEKVVVYAEYDDNKAINEILRYLREVDVKVLGVDVVRDGSENEGLPCARFELQLHRKITPEIIVKDIDALHIVYKAEELNQMKGE